MISYASSLTGWRFGAVEHLAGVRHRGRRPGHVLGLPLGKRVRLTEPEVEALRDHLARQVVLLELHQDQGLVFATQKGTLVNPSNLRKRSFAPLLESSRGSASTTSAIPAQHCCWPGTSIPR